MKWTPYPLACVSSEICSGNPANADRHSTSWADADSWASVSGLSGLPLSACSIEYHVTFPASSAQAIQPWTMGPTWGIGPLLSIPECALAWKLGTLDP